MIKVASAILHLVTRFVYTDLRALKSAYIFFYIAFNRHIRNVVFKSLTGKYKKVKYHKNHLVD